MKKYKATVIDYGMGNIWSVTSALQYLGCEVDVSSDALVIERAQTLILPGVGSFRKAMNALISMNLEASILNSVLARKAKFLGICLGMQLMGTKSSEDGETKGLGLIPSSVDKFSSSEVAKYHTLALIKCMLTQMGIYLKVFRAIKISTLYTHTECCHQIRKQDFPPAIMGLIF
jgi:imidazoleglycerol phosphate synthase glutamine amidotransferase subunit HisH